MKQGHNGAVWDVKFGPYGYYFASCGMDRTARVWASDQYQSMRIYVDHLSDVECICFHPNCNYLATGSSDRCVRIFDIGAVASASTSSGATIAGAEQMQLLLASACVRQFTGHKLPINVLKFSACGRLLASGGADACVLVWDVPTSVLVARFVAHTGPVYALEFSRDNTVLASGGMDNAVKVWNMAKLVREIEQADDLSKFEARGGLASTTTSSSASDSMATGDNQFEMGSWLTKKTPVMHLHFTRRNLLIGLGLYKP